MMPSPSNERSSAPSALKRATSGCSLKVPVNGWLYAFAKTTTKEVLERRESPFAEGQVDLGESQQAARFEGFGGQGSGRLPSVRCSLASAAGVPRDIISDSAAGAPPWACSSRRFDG